MCSPVCLPINKTVTTDWFSSYLGKEVSGEFLAEKLTRIGLMAPRPPAGEGGPGGEGGGGYQPEPPINFGDGVIFSHIHV